GLVDLTLEYEPTYGCEEYAGYLTTNSHLFCHYHRIIRQPLAKKNMIRNVGHVRASFSDQWKCRNTP
ncbi:10375_t:CDS:1, partial [Entrophospora sp. SA101]